MRLTYFQFSSVIIIKPGRLDEWTLACDPTTINPMLPSYLKRKGNVLLKAFKAKHAEKMRKHAHACEALNTGPSSRL